MDIIDYGMGNLRSVQKAFQRIGTTSRIIASPDEVLHSAKLVLPGVGHFARAIQILKSRGLFDALNQAVLVKKTPILGICLGMQLMTGFSEEGDAAGLGWINARTKKFVFTDKGPRIPHMGWNGISILKNSPLLNNLAPDALFYFVHSYYVACDQEDTIISRTCYGTTFASAFQHENIYGCQFHPEKSHDAGLQILKNFAYR
ncbi:MAG: imidazole glycerol phosphate synthase subunit HisH [Desulfobacteraceae bacterium]|jgi:glutamine amidotransferase|nr:MAG: imidazole glycerol phosphate synthase subunit HisH [Desulfobacteraceae bacterium]